MRCGSLDSLAWEAWPGSIRPGVADSANGTVARLNGSAYGAGTALLKRLRVELPAAPDPAKPASPAYPASAIREPRTARSGFAYAASRCS